MFGPLGVYDGATGNAAHLNAIRWAEINTAPGGPSGLARRARDSNFMQDAIFYFMIMDPAATPPVDPRPSLPTNYFTPGTGHLFARTGWGPDATWFTYMLSWNGIDHQHGDGNHFEFYRRGEWLTKERTGYGLPFGASDNHNTLALQNEPPQHNASDDYRHMLWQRGSQWEFVNSGDPQLLAISAASTYAYALGDATRLYNSDYEGSTGITHASRSIVWLKPDYIIVYDRAASANTGRFKRFWLQLPVQPSISGNRATLTTAKG